MNQAAVLTGTRSGRPSSGEYVSYFEKYVSLVSGDDAVSALETQRRDTMVLLSSLSDESGDIRYAPGKWSVKEVLGHVNDTERIMVYRALRIARGDKTPLPGFEQDDYVKHANFGEQSVCELLEEYIAVRRATLALFRPFSEIAWTSSGTASNFPITARALAFIVAGHELHHRRILQEKYFQR